MTYKPPIGEWLIIPDWQDGSLAFLAARGLFRFRLDRRVVFIGYAASSKQRLGGRIAVYRRGGVKTPWAAQQIAMQKDKLELQVMLLDDPPAEIRAFAKLLIRQEDPPLNTRNSYAGRF